MNDDRQPFDIDLIPELATRVGMPGAMRHAEIGGRSVTETGVLIALLVFNISEE